MVIDTVDDDPSIFLLLAFFGALVILILLITFSITVCIAWSATRTWRKEKARKFAASTESEAFIKGAYDPDSESELDPEDSDDEAELKIREEKRRDMTLTSRQYFRKELKKYWKGNVNAQNAQKVKERGDRKKLAKALARELMKLERKRDRKVVGGGSKEL